MKAPISEEQLLYYADSIFDLCKSSEQKVRRFDGFVPIIPEMYDDEEIFFSDATPDALDCDAYVSVLHLGNAGGRTKEQRQWQFHKFRKISAKELRKRTGLFAINPYCYETAYESLQKVQYDYFTFRNERIVHIENPNFPYTQFSRKEIERSAQLSLGVQFYIENTPHVYLKPENSDIGFTYPISDLSQLKELFSLRDIQDGYKRRAALKHWVAKHLRHKRRNPDETVEIKRYLRGKETFKWFGITGTIFPCADS